MRIVMDGSVMFDSIVPNAGLNVGRGLIAHVLNRGGGCIDADRPTVDHRFGFRRSDRFLACDERLFALFPFLRLSFGTCWPDRQRLGAGGISIGGSGIGSRLAVAKGNAVGRRLGTVGRLHRTIFGTTPTERCGAARLNFVRMSACRTVAAMAIDRMDHRRSAGPGLACPGMVAIGGRFGAIARRRLAAPSKRCTATGLAPARRFAAARRLAAARGSAGPTRTFRTAGGFGVDDVCQRDEKQNECRYKQFGCKCAHRVTSSTLAES